MALRICCSWVWEIKRNGSWALAYKLVEVAYLKVVYSSHASAFKDRQELQTSLQTGPTGESPSSSASDIDNMNNPAAAQGRWGNPRHIASRGTEEF
jgi:hypothetical protein